MEAKAEVEAALLAGRTELSKARVSYNEKCYSRIVHNSRAELPIIVALTKTKRRRVKQRKTKNLHDRLVFHKHETLAFAYDLSVPFDNNLADRYVRMAKVKHKMSGCLQSEHGAHRFRRSRGYLFTLRKQGRNILSSLRDAFQGNAFDSAYI